ncbi:hypothetical protein UF75_5059 [Desulfosporosinus sp. I2]|nr:hypothetical protein UF75_5059 [Desulfosporosinus sp. I2]
MQNAVNRCKGMTVQTLGMYVHLDIRGRNMPSRLRKKQQRKTGSCPGK